MFKKGRGEKVLVVHLMMNSRRQE